MTEIQATAPETEEKPWDQKVGSFTDSVRDDSSETIEENGSLAAVDGVERGIEDGGAEPEAEGGACYVELLESHEEKSAELKNPTKKTHHRRPLAGEYTIDATTAQMSTLIGAYVSKWYSLRCIDDHRLKDLHRRYEKDEERGVVPRGDHKIPVRPERHVQGRRGNPRRPRTNNDLVSSALGGCVLSTRTCPVILDPRCPCFLGCVLLSSIYANKS
ncbi:glucose-1-phosphate adenylyltransferase [Striga asiatica]|uniref:Glucose-1-phosphate adenylyltransferase n=1 Tax=Striga asiatica TaxID=4170 RepID=A0A5A7QQ43_STRAF|nr:glucose-1-phosphate adenylyltransferase [Striga asiatica]